MAQLIAFSILQLLAMFEYQTLAQMADSVAPSAEDRRLASVQMAKELKTTTHKILTHILMVAMGVTLRQPLMDITTAPINKPAGAVMFILVASKKVAQAIQVSLAN